MKRGLLALLAIILISNTALAQEITKPGYTPGSIFYGLERAIERMQLGISGSGIPKARLHILFAEERLAEAKALTDKNKPARVNELIVEYEENIAKGEAEIDKAAGIKLDTSQVSEQLEVARNKHIAVLEAILEKVPDSAKQGIERALENAKKHASQLKEKNKKAGLFADILESNEELSQEELKQKAEELRQREEELNEREEEQKGRGLLPITGFTTIQQQEYELLKQRMGIIFLITIIGTLLYFSYINHRRHKELLRKKK